MKHSTQGWSIPIIAHSQGTHYTALSRGALRAVTGVLIPYMADIGLARVWLRYSVTKKLNSSHSGFLSAGHAWQADPKIALHFLRPSVCLSPLITCAIIMSCKLLP